MYENKQIEKISDIITDKIKLFENFSKANNYNRTCSYWFTEWNDSHKKDKLTKLDNILLTPNETKKLNNYIERYFELLEYLEKDMDKKDEFHRYEQLFNKTIQIPDELLYYVNTHVKTHNE